MPGIEPLQRLPSAILDPRPKLSLGRADVHEQPLAINAQRLRGDAPLLLPGVQGHEPIQPQLCQADGPWLGQMSGECTTQKPL